MKTMLPKVAIRALVAACVTAALWCSLTAELRATASYDYKPGEFLVIKGGLSPDKKFSIVAGEDQKLGFRVCLMDAQTKKRLGPLEEVVEPLDTAPDALYAHWSPDSKHVGISYRSDRHWTENIIYRIENRRAYLVETPELMCQAVPDFCRLEKELGGRLPRDKEESAEAPAKVRQLSRYSEIVKWISPTRFVVREESQFQVRTRNPAATLGKYAEESEKRKEEGAKAGESYWFVFSAEGECELLPNDKSRVVSTRPAKNQSRD
jgi:hypothetical protein